MENSTTITHGKYITAGTPPDAIRVSVVPLVMGIQSAEKAVSGKRNKIMDDINMLMFHITLLLIVTSPPHISISELLSLARERC